MKNAMHEKVDFARFCIREKVEPLVLAELAECLHKLISLEDKLSDGNLREFHGGYDLAAIALRSEIENRIAAIGWKVKGWPGFYPWIVGADGFDLHLPSY